MNDILVDDHAEVDALLRGLTAAFDGGDAREVLSKLDYVWARLAIHIRAEHLHLFTALSRAVNEARALSAAGPRADAVRLRQVKDRVLAVATRLAEHNRVEEEQVYLWQEELLGEEARGELRASMRRELENVPPRFLDGAHDA